jgi:hypothetical protein
MIVCIYIYMLKTFMELKGDNLPAWMREDGWILQLGFAPFVMSFTDQKSIG